MPGINSGSGLSFRYLEESLRQDTQEQAVNEPVTTGTGVFTQSGIQPAYQMDVERTQELVEWAEQNRLIEPQWVSIPNPTATVQVEQPVFRYNPQMSDTDIIREAERIMKPKPYKVKKKKENGFTKFIKANPKSFGSRECQTK